MSKQTNWKRFGECVIKAVYSTLEVSGEALSNEQLEEIVQCRIKHVSNKDAKKIAWRVR